MDYLTAVTFLDTTDEDFDFESDTIPDLCAMRTLYPVERDICMSVWDLTRDTEGCICVIDELDDDPF